MLAGTLGAGLSAHLSDEEAVYVIILSYLLQSMGCIISLQGRTRVCTVTSARLEVYAQKLSAWMLRNVVLGHPSDKRIVPVFFMAAGPPGAQC
jgi:hypothetical protein